MTRLAKTARNRAVLLRSKGFAVMRIQARLNESDESSVRLDNHARICFRKQKQPRKLKPKPKHPTKVHIWAGISSRGATPVVIFTGIMNSTRYCSILENGLLKEVFPDGHRWEEKDVNWFKHQQRAQT